MNRLGATILALAPLLPIAVGTELWIHETFGINLPCETPDHFHVCGREYRLGGPLGDPSRTYTFTARPTVFDLPIPMPDVAPIDGSMEWGGCPLQVLLERDEGDVEVYAFIQGGP